MKRRLCTHAGKFGDILWSLMVAKEFAMRDEQPVDFAIRKPYESLLELLKMQPYIADAYVIQEWTSWGSPHGDQPWESPEHERRRQYSIVNDLGYRKHPVLPLAKDMADQQSIQLRAKIFPFLEIPSTTVVRSLDQIAVGFGEGSYEKSVFLRYLRNLLPNFTFIDVEQVPWVEACRIMKSSLGFLGARSSNSVLAFGLDVPVVIFEPDHHRNKPCFSPPCILGPPWIGGNEIQVRLPHQAQAVFHALQRSGGQFPQFAPLTYSPEYPFYLECHPDVRAAGLVSPDQVRQHFYQYGIQEGRIWAMDPILYRFLYADLSSCSDDELRAHFIQYGKQEGRLCCRKAVPMQ